MLNEADDMNDNERHAEKFERLDRELIYEAHVFKVYQDTLKTPEDKVVHWDHIGHKGAAAVVAVTDEGKLLMVRQYRNSSDRITLEIPAGGRSSLQEPTLECASRELEEETGYKTDKLEFLITVVPEIAFCDEFIDIYVAKDLVPSKRNLDPDEFIDIEEWEVDELIDLIYKGEIKDSKTVAAVLAYDKKYR